LRINNQIFIEWTIANVYKDFSFSDTIQEILQTTQLDEGETIEVHQVVNIGEFNNEKKFLIILNVKSNKNNI
jgi:hypothetical protein